MLGSEMKQFREALKLDRAKFGELLGYTGRRGSNAVSVKRTENSEDPVPLYLARYIWMIQEHLARTGNLPVFPAWGYYEYDHTPDPDHMKAEANAD